MKLQLSYEIMFGYVQKLQIPRLIPLSFPSFGRARLGWFLGLTLKNDRKLY